MPIYVLVSPTLYRAHREQRGTVTEKAALLGGPLRDILARLRFLQCQLEGIWQSTGVDVYRGFYDRVMS